MNNYVKYGLLSAAVVGTLAWLAVGGNSGSHLNVVYTGVDPLPDTFKDHADALADGKLEADGAFHATKIQAKCASKYEAKPDVPNPAVAKPI